MRKITMSLLVALGLGIFSPANAKKEHILPLPQELVAAQGQLTFAAGSKVTVAGVDVTPALVNFFREFGITQVTFDKNAKSGQVVVKMVERIEGAYDHQVPLFENEAYTLKVTTQGVEITAVTPTGVIRAAQTLTQLAEGWEGGSGVNLEAVTVNDWPAFKVRGFMQDVGRSFLSVDELKTEIDRLSRFKINVFHWHLTEKLAWRFEVKKYPQLTADEHMVRYPGQYYTQEDCRALVDYAGERGVKVIPEIDMPGHSDVFTKAMGFDMQSEKGIEALKFILDEVADVFAKSPYIHIGGDEVRINDPKYLENMAGYVRAKGKKVVMWNRLVAGAPTAAQCDMTQMWATSGNVVKGLPNIDCRYNYTNHFDVYADLVGIYKSTIYGQTQGTPDVAGTISAAWNDTKTRTERDIVLQNNIYANVLASAERAWKGGGRQYIEQGGTVLPNSGDEFEEFADFERRLLFHKDHALKDQPIAYVKQTNVRWRITDPFPNQGRKDLQLPPETDRSEVLPDAFDYEGETYGSHIATGAGIYLRHIWHPVIPSFYKNPGNNQTAYAWTYVFSEKEQPVGAQIEFYTYSRSGGEKAPEKGCWDRRGSKVWLNGSEIAAPAWDQPGKNIPQDHATEGLTNENFTARDVVPLTLKAGWNKVLLRLPHVDNGGTGRDKWQFTFVLTTPDGRHAAEGLIYSPNQCKDAAAEEVAAKVAEVKAFRRSQVRDVPGYYAGNVAAALDARVAAIEKTFAQEMTPAERSRQLQELDEALRTFKAGLAGAQLVQPKVSAGEDNFYYTLSTPLRDNRFASSAGAGAPMTGEQQASPASYWKFVERADKSYNIVNYQDNTYVSPESGNNTALKTQKAEPGKGWTLKASDEVGYFIVTSGGVQFNQTNSGNGWKVFNWGSGTELKDAGCKYAVRAVEVVEGPVKMGAYYTLSTPLRDNCLATSAGAGKNVFGAASASAQSYWTFENRSDHTYNIRNYGDGTYIYADGKNIRSKAEVPAQGWELKPAKDAGLFVIVSGTAQFNQSDASNGGRPVLNWGSGSNLDDKGCQYKLTLAESLPPRVDPAMPVAGKNYYFVNEHMEGDQYFYDKAGAVGFSARKMDRRKSYVWVCEKAANGNFYFKNLLTNKYFAWQSLSGAAYEWQLSTAKDGTAKVTNAGCVSMKAVKQGGSNYLVCKQGIFDQAGHAGYYDKTFSSDFRFELCTNTDWEYEEKPQTVNYYSKAFGDNWVRIYWNKNKSTAAAMKSAAADYTNMAAKCAAADFTSEDQLWTLVGDGKDGFLMQNRVAGEQLALSVTSTGDGTGATMVDKSRANRWKLVESADGVFAIVHAGATGRGLNSWAGALGELKMYAANNDGSQWKLQPELTEAFTMTTLVTGESPYGDRKVSAGEHQFVIDGVKYVSAVPAAGSEAATYYLPKKARVVVSQVDGTRGFVKAGMTVKGKDVGELAFTVGETVGEVVSAFAASLENGRVLYFTPDDKGHPYRIPAIATAVNGDIFAISDNRPCGMDIGFGEVDVKCRISRDNGKTWGEEFFVADGVGDNNNGQVWRTGFGDAAFVADRERNELLVMMVCGKTVCHNGNYIPNSPASNPNRVAQVRATLDEKTGEWVWTEPEEVTETIYPLFVKNGEATVKSLFIGSGRICQSRVTKVGDYYRLYCSTWTKNGGNRVIYSDDFGKSWHILGTVDDRPGGGGDEPKCEEMPNGNVILSSRRDGRLFNIFTYSNVEKGEGSWQTEEWSETRPGGIVVNNTTNGEMMLVKAVRLSDEQKVDLALQSVPFGGGRNNVGFFFKEIDAEAQKSALALASHWTKGLQVSHKGSAYSTMALQHDHKIGFFFEEEPGNYCMVYIPLTLEKITENAYRLDQSAYPTGLDKVVAGAGRKESRIYDLSGRRVMTPSKGIYIVNGEKVILK